MTVYDRLKRYKAKKSRCEYLKLQLDGLIDSIQNGHGISETREETIEGVALRTNTEGMPTGGFDESKTERIALNIDKERAKLRANTNQMFEQRKVLEQELAPIEKEVKETETMLSVLGKEHRFVIEKWFFDGLRIAQIQDAFYDEFKNYPCYKTIQNIKSKAVKKMSYVIR